MTQEVFHKHITGWLKAMYREGELRFLYNHVKREAPNDEMKADLLDKIKSKAEYLKISL